jgi:hypothetical protein
MTDQLIYLARIYGDYQPIQSGLSLPAPEQELEHELGVFTTLEAAQRAITAKVPLLTEFTDCDEWVAGLNTSIWNVREFNNTERFFSWPIDADSMQAVPVEQVFPDGGYTVIDEPQIWTCRSHSNRVDSVVFTDNTGWDDLWDNVRGTVYAFTLQD